MKTVMSTLVFATVNAFSRPRVVRPDCHSLVGKLDFAFVLANLRGVEAKRQESSDRAGRRRKGTGMAALLSG